MRNTRKYIGTYRVFAPLDYNTGKSTANTNDTYLQGRSNTECYRMDKKTLALYFPKGRSTANIILPELDKLEVDYKLHIEGDYELIYTFPEDQIHKVHSVVKFKTQGKNIKPESIKTARKQIKKTAK